MSYRAYRVNVPLYTREEILQQIFELLESVSSATNVFRNRGLLRKQDLPAIILYDGIEEGINMRPTVPEMKTVKQLPILLRMQPQIYVVLLPRDDPSNETLNGQFAPIGPELSYYRDTILNTVINDPTLITMMSPMGQINFRGSQTDMQSGRTMIGNLRILIDFHYLWSPQQG